MPYTVSELETRLSQYKHYSQNFVDVLNEVVPRLAQMGIWRDLTFEKTTKLETGETFLTVPNNAEAPLFALNSNTPVPVSPLWQDYITLGAANRPNATFGYVDAGLGPTYEILNNDLIWRLAVFPFVEYRKFESGTDPSGSDNNFTGNESFTIKYRSFTGAPRTITESPTAGSNPHVFAAGDISAIDSIEYEGVTTELMVVAYECKWFGTVTWDGANGWTLANNADYTRDGTNILSTSDLSAIEDQVDGTSVVATDTMGFVPLVRDNATAVRNGTVSTVSAASVTGTETGGYGAGSDLVAVYANYNGEATNDDGRVVAYIGPGEGRTRYRHFRVGPGGTNVHVLYRRKILPLEKSTDLVYLDDISAIKHAILAHTAEQENDRDAAMEEWKAAKQILDEDLAEYLGAALPKPQIDPFGGQPTIPSIQ